MKEWVVLYIPLCGFSFKEFLGDSVPQITSWRGPSRSSISGEAPRWSGRCDNRRYVITSMASVLGRRELCGDFHIRSWQ